MLELGSRQYFAVVDDQHNVKDPVTIIRVFDNDDPDCIRELSPDVVWVRTTLLDRIAAGEVPYQARPINEKQALRIRKRWERKISYRYFVLVDEDDPNDEPVSVIREWDSTTGDAVYEEQYVAHRVQQWLPSNQRWMSTHGREDRRFRVLPSDAATVNFFISSLAGW